MQISDWDGTGYQRLSISLQKHLEKSVFKGKKAAEGQREKTPERRAALVNILVHIHNMNE